MSKTHNRTVSVVGLGYVGLPVAVAFGKQKQCIGFDINQRRIDQLRQGIDLTHEVSSDDLASTDILYTADRADLKQADFHIIGVPTPINEAKQPDLTPLIRASETVGTKWNFLPFQPGLVGGHGIGVDPYYLTHKAEKRGYHPEVILAGRRINDGMGEYLAGQAVTQMIAEDQAIKGAKVLYWALPLKRTARTSEIQKLKLLMSFAACKAEVLTLLFTILRPMLVKPRMSIVCNWSMTAP